MLNGLVAAAATVALGTPLPPEIRLSLLAGILWLTAGVYVGFGIMDGRAGAARPEWVGAALYGGAALAGTSFHPAFLAAGWLSHVLWDLAHHSGWITTEHASWVPGFCFGYDVPVGVAVLVWWWPF